MTCTNPQHLRVGEPACTKTVSVASVGDEDSCIKMLKTWILVGMHLDSKAAHKSAWDEVKMYKNIVSNCLHIVGNKLLVQDEAAI